MNHTFNAYQIRAIKALQESGFFEMKYPSVDDILDCALEMATANEVYRCMDENEKAKNNK